MFDKALNHAGTYQPGTDDDVDAIARFVMLSTGNEQPGDPIYESVVFECLGLLISNEIGISTVTKAGRSFKHIHDRVKQGPEALEPILTIPEWTEATARFRSGVLSGFGPPAPKTLSSRREVNGVQVVSERK